MSALIEDIVRSRQELVNAYIDQRITRCGGDFTDDDYDLWDTEAHVRWRKKYPAFTALLPSHLPTTRTPEESPDE